MAAPDDELFAAAVGGDEDALVALLERNDEGVRHRLTGSIPRRWQSLLTLDDVMQQTYVDAFRDIRGFVPRGEGAFAAWLAKLAKRNLLDALKLLEAQKRGGHRRRVEPHHREDSYVELYERLGGTTSTPSRKAARIEAGEALERALQSLPPTYRRAVESYDLQGRPVEEVAAALRRSPGAVYMLRARAHRLLAELMGTASRYFSDVT